MKSGFKKAICLLMALGIGIALTGCGTNVATVNGENIAQSQFNKRLNKQKEAMQQQGANFNNAQGKKMLDQTKKQVLDGMVDELLVLQAAKKEGVAAKKSEVDAKLKAIKQSFKSEKEYQDVLKQWNYTDEDMNNLIAFQITESNLYNKVTSKASVSDNELKSYYEANKAQMNGIKVRDILVNTEDDAKKVIADLKSGKDFAKLALEKSQDTITKNDGGLLTDKQAGKQYWAKGEMLDQTFGLQVEDAAFGLKKGEYSQAPIMGQSGGYYVIKVDDIKQLSFDEAKDTIKQKLLKDKKDQIYSDYLAKNKQKAVIKTNLK